MAKRKERQHLSTPGSSEQGAQCWDPSVILREVSTDSLRQPLPHKTSGVITKELADGLCPQTCLFYGWPSRGTEPSSLPRALFPSLGTSKLFQPPKAEPHEGVCQARGDHIGGASQHSALMVGVGCLKFTPGKLCMLRPMTDFSPSVHFSVNTSFSCTHVTFRRKNICP